MKKIISFILLLFPVLLFCQELQLPFADGKLLYEKVDSFKAKKDLLFSIAKQWAVDQFNNANYVVQNDDRENGKLSGKFTFDKLAGGLLKTTYHATFTIDCKDNKARIRIYDFMFGLAGDENRNVDLIIAQQRASGIDISKVDIWGDLNDGAVRVIKDFEDYMKKNLKDNF